MRVSIPVAVWGATFGSFLEGWWDAVEAMTRKPDEIVIGYENPDMAGAYDSIRRLPGVDVIGVVLEEDGFTERWNEVMRACTGDWIAPVCVDDRVLPDALAEIDAADEAGAELLVDSIAWKYRGDVWRGHWDPEAIGRVLTLPGAAPFKRSLFERVGGFKPWLYSSDWAFYMDAAVAGAKTYQANTIRIIFDEGNAHATRSGVQMDGATRSMADEQIRAYARSVGLV